MLGKSGTTVRLLQFEDLQCPICKRYTDEAFPAIVNEYVRTGRIKVDFRGLAFLGPDSLKALKIAMAAGLQNKLWQVVGLFYENQGAENTGWVTDSLIDEILAAVPGLDAAKVKVDAKGTQVAKQIAAINARGDQAEGAGNTVVLPPGRLQPAGQLPAEVVRAERVPHADRSGAEGRLAVTRDRIGALLVATALSLAIVAGVGASTSSPGTALVDGIPQRGTVMGQVSANVTLIQFEDLGCTHCAEYMKDAFPTIINDYVKTGLVKVDFRGLGVVTRASAPALRYTLAASRQKKLWQVAELFYENQSRLNELATDAGVKRMVGGVKGLDAKLLVADSKTLSVKKQVAAHAAEATRRNVPGTPWFFIKVGAAPPKVVRPDAYDGESFSALLDDALGR